MEGRKQRERRTLNAERGTSNGQRASGRCHWFSDFGLVCGLLFDLSVMKVAVMPRDGPAPLCGALAEVIREEREARGLSGYALAKRAGVERESIRKIERRDTKATSDMLARICAVFEIKVSELVARAERRL